MPAFCFGSASNGGTFGMFAWPTCALDTHIARISAKLRKYEMDQPLRVRTGAGPAELVQQLTQLISAKLIGSSGMASAALQMARHRCHYANSFRSEIYLTTSQQLFGKSMPVCRKST